MACGFHAGPAVALVGEERGVVRGAGGLCHGLSAFGGNSASSEPRPRSIASRMTVARDTPSPGSRDAIASSLFLVASEIAQLNCFRFAMP